MTRRLPRYCSEFADRHGKMRVRFRRKGYATHYFRSLPWSPAFMAEYQACMEGSKAPAPRIGGSRAPEGTISALIASYYAAPEFTGLKPATQSTYRNIIERFREEHGAKRVASLERRHLKAIIGAKSATPAAANHLLRLLKMLMDFAVDEGLRKDNPAHGLKGFRLETDGFHTWTEEEIAAFEARHPIGSKPRLALALMLYTGQRRSDAVRMGWQHVSGDRISVKQKKTTKRLAIRMHRTLVAVLAGTPRTDMTFLVTGYGKPFSAAGFGNWFRERCNEAGLPQCAAHGLRKAAARRMAEAGCTNQEIKAVTGHVTDREVSRYTAAADQNRLADQAMTRVESAEREQAAANRPDGLAKTAFK